MYATSPTNSRLDSKHLNFFPIGPSTHGDSIAKQSQRQPLPNSLPRHPEGLLVEQYVERYLRGNTTSKEQLSRRPHLSATRSRTS